LVLSPLLLMQDAPTECARLFVARVKRFMAKHIKPDKGEGLLGKVLHYLIRYEVQDRWVGSSGAQARVQGGKARRTRPDMSCLPQRRLCVPS
jgi:hypothetical protein